MFDFRLNEFCPTLVLQKDDFGAVSSLLRKYLPEKDTPYILDVDLDFFSTRNPFKSLHERVNLYEKLAPLFTYKRPESNDPEVSLSFAATRTVQSRPVGEVSCAFFGCDWEHPVERERNSQFLNY